MKDEKINGTFYDIYEVDDKLVFRIYGKKNKVISTFKVVSTFQNVGVKVAWLVACLLSPFYFMLIILDALIIGIFLFFTVVAVLSGVNIFFVLLTSICLVFVYAFGVGRLVHLLDPKFDQLSQKKKLLIFR